MNIREGFFILYLVFLVSSTTYLIAELHDAFQSAGWQQQIERP